MENQEFISLEDDFNGDGAYRTDICVGKIREKIFFNIVLVLLIWPAAIISAVIAIVIFQEAYFKITIPVLIVSFLLIAPLAFIVSKMGKRYHLEYEFTDLSVLFEVKNKKVYMDGKKIKIRYMIDEDIFNLYTGFMKGYFVEGGITEEFRTFLENNRIPYK